MSKTLATVDEIQLESDIQEAVLEEFVGIINIIEPEHSFSDEWKERRSGLYPIETSEVDYGYCQTNGKYVAKCGPRRCDSPYTRVKCGFNIDKHRFAVTSIERRLVIYLHEMCHLKYGSHSHSTAHPPVMWRTLAFYSQLTLDRWEKVTKIMHGELSVERFKSKLKEDPNRSMVDRRQQTVNDVREEIGQFVEEYGVGIS